MIDVRVITFHLGNDPLYIDTDLYADLYLLWKQPWIVLGPKSHFTPEPKGFENPVALGQKSWRSIYYPGLVLSIWCQSETDYCKVNHFHTKNANIKIAYQCILQIFEICMHTLCNKLR